MATVRHKILSYFGCPLLLSVLTYAQPAQATSRVKSTKGSVYQLMTKNHLWHQLQVGDVLVPGARLFIESDSELQTDIGELITGTRFLKYGHQKHDVEFKSQPVSEISLWMRSLAGELYKKCIRKRTSDIYPIEVMAPQPEEVLFKTKSPLMTEFVWESVSGTKALDFILIWPTNKIAKIAVERTNLNYHSFVFNKPGEYSVMIVSGKIDRCSKEIEFSVVEPDPRSGEKYADFFAPTAIFPTKNIEFLNSSIPTDINFLWRLPPKTADLNHDYFELELTREGHDSVRKYKLFNNRAKIAIDRAGRFSWRITAFYHDKSDRKFKFSGASQSFALWRRPGGISKLLPQVDQLDLPAVDGIIYVDRLFP
jgi:hypothetical protein